MAGSAIVTRNSPCAIDSLIPVQTYLEHGSVHEVKFRQKDDGEETSLWKQEQPASQQVQSETAQVDDKEVDHLLTK